MGTDHTPTHAYVPGKTARHPEGAFDAIRDTAQPNLTPAQLFETDAFQIGLTYIHTGFFWEAHELLEPVWMALPNPSGERHLVQALIQIANGFLKLKMDRPKAAARLFEISKQLLKESDETSGQGKCTPEAYALLGALGDKIDDVL